jgi:lipoate-protein ligase A
MIARKDYKVPGGKLVRVEIEIEAGVVQRAAVKGDFFAHPEEAFERAEAGLSALRAEELPSAALRLFGERGLSIFGATAEDIAFALERAVREAQAD